MTLFDSHCHLENEGFQNDLPEVMQRMAQAGVRRCVLGGSDLETSRRIVALAKEHEGVYGAVGVHPHEAKTWTDETEAELEGMLTQPWARSVWIISTIFLPVTSSARYSSSSWRWPVG